MNLSPTSHLRRVGAAVSASLLLLAGLAATAPAASAE